jgi:N-acetylmuramoyl-L-alanine amidase
VLAALAACGASNTPVTAPGARGPGVPNAASVIASTSARPAGRTGSRAPSAGAPAPSPQQGSRSPGVRPAIHQWPIPFGRARRREMAAYSLRHYGEDSYRLRHPKVIVEHYTETVTARQAYNTFAPDVPDSEFGELPNTCAHFLVDPAGRIDQLVSLSLRCRHTVGLNWTAVGIENVGLSDRQVLDDRAQLAASLRLTQWLRCTYGIALKNVIGHNESLSSPYHRDRVAAFRHQTHTDFDHADMRVYRRRLGRLACPRW